MEADIAARIAALKTHPAWADLTAEIESVIASYSVALAKTMLATGKPPGVGDTMSFEYKRGFLAGLRAITRYPDTATDFVKRETAKANQEDEL